MPSCHFRVLRAPQGYTVQRPARAQNDVFPGAMKRSTSSRTVRCTHRAQCLMRPFYTSSKIHECPNCRLRVCPTCYFGITREHKRPPCMGGQLQATSHASSGQHRPALIVPTCSAAHGSAPVPLNIPAGGCLLSAQQLEVCQCLRLPPDTVMALRRNIYVVDEAVVRNFQVQAAVHYAQQPYGDNYTGTAALWTCRHETSGYEVMACHLPAHLCAKDATELYAAIKAGTAAMTECRQPARKGMFTGGLTNALNGHALAGFYAAEQKDPAAGSSVDRLISKLSWVTEQAFSWQVHQLALSVSGLSSRQKQAPFQTIAVTEDYHIDAHVDGHDLPFSAIAWFLPKDDITAKSTFRMPSLKAWWTPSHGSLVVLNSKEVVHGTYGGEDAQARAANWTGILGVALFSKGDVVRASGLTVTTALAVATELVKRGMVRKNVFTTGDVEAAVGAVQAMKIAK